MIIITKLIILSLILSILFGCSSVKSTFSTIPLPLSAVRSPVTLDLGRVLNPINGQISFDDKNRLLEISEQQRNQCPQEQFNQSLDSENKNSFDGFCDLCDEETLVFVAISGGGARAASLATHTMALLEKKYNLLNKITNRKSFKKGDIKSLIDRIHVISTVSGGSIYAYQIARIKTILDNSDKENINIKLRDEIFQNIEALDLKAHNLGLYSSAWYLSPGNLFLGPLLTLFTNSNYLNILSGGLNGMAYLNDLNYFNNEEGELKNECSYDIPNCITTEKRKPSSLKKALNSYKNLFNPAHIKLSNISNKPRFFFNATTLETGLPFVFTQRYVNLPETKELLKSVRYDIINKEVFSAALQTATTLEEINSTPKAMPLAYAAMASAAFPMGLEPLKLIKYGFNPVNNDIYETSERIHVSDGGIYDNSGLTALKDLVFHLKGRNCKTKQLVLLSINADADEYDLFYPHRIASEVGFFQKSPININFPFRTGIVGVDALNLIHFVNKRRAEQIAIDAILKLKDGDNKTIQLKYFPVSLGQLSHYERYKINDPSNLYEKSLYMTKNRES